MKISQEDGILIFFKISVKAVWCTKAVAWISRLGLEAWKNRQSAKKNPQDGYSCPASCGNQAAVYRFRRLAVEDLMLSQEDKPKKHRSAHEISCETSILCSSVHRIIHLDGVISSSNASNDVVLSCCLKPIASPVSLADKQSYRLQ